MIQLNDKYRIRQLDSQCVVVEKLEDVEDSKTKIIKKVWQVAGYFSNVKHCMTFIERDFMLNSVGNESSILDLKEYFEKIKSININIEFVEKKRK